jgi:adenylate cyclase
LGEQALKNIARPVRVYRVRDRAVPVEQPLAASPQPLPLPDKPSIAVLSFANMSGDRVGSRIICPHITPAASRLSRRT